MVNQSSMDEAFDRSLHRFLTSDEDASPEPFASLEAAIAYCGGDTVESDGTPTYPGHRALAVVALKEFLGQLEEPFGLCGSPVERLLLSALIVVGHTKSYALHLRGKQVTYELTSPNIDTLVIQPQAQLGEHRVDFLVTQESIVPDFDHKRTLPDGMIIPGHMEVTKHLIVECDGHDFHDRTKEQASKDRARDRALQSLGYRVYRYTGSDLWRDVCVYAVEVVTALNREVYPDVKPRG